MKKIWMISAAASALLMAENVETQSLEEQLESKKIISTKGTTDLLNISLILDASYNNISFDNEDETAHLEIPGLVHGSGHDHEGHSHTSLAGDEGANFNYAELSIGASVDNYFDMLAVFHMTENDFEVEEAFVTTLGLPYSLRAKIGKFKSDFGYLNNKHHHNYNFADMPLIYQSLLGDHGLTETGMQLQYVVPAPHYVMIGVEALTGDNEQSFGTEGFAPSDVHHDHEEEGDEDNHDEAAAGVEDTDYPSLWVGYIKTSLDIAGGTMLAGASIAKGDSRINHLEDENPHAFAGDTTFYGADLVYKYYFAADRAITWQSEYLYRELEGTQYVPATDAEVWAKQVDMLKEQGGYYTELIYQHDKNWRAGARYSAISQNDVTVNGKHKPISDDMYIASAMLEYNPSEFSRIRLQYNHNSALYNDEGEKNNKDEIILQFNYAIGAHGAHAF